MRAFKFLTADGSGVFSGFAWPLPDGAPGAWVESEVDPCRSGIHACRPSDLPYWLADALYEIELDGPLDEQAVKVVAPRGRLIRRVESWDDAMRERYSQMCFARAGELSATNAEVASVLGRGVSTIELKLARIRGHLKADWADLMGESAEDRT